MKASKDWNGKHILINRTDSIGDVMLTLPITAWLKEQFPTCKITFLCRNYTAPLVVRYKAVDQIIKLDDFQSLSQTEQIQTIEQLNVDVVIHVFPRKELAKLFKKARVPQRIGTSHRFFHLTTCNIRPNFTRKKSPLHEAQLNFELLRPLGLNTIPSLDQINNYTLLFQIEQVTLPSEFENLLDTQFVILHPKSQGSAKEWPIDKYLELSKQLIVNGYEIVFTGTETEGEKFRSLIPNEAGYHDSTGKLTIEQLLVLIQQAQALVACSTGPLHLAGFLNTPSIGLFSPKKPIHPGRWRPLGKHVQTLVFEESCERCRAKKECNCIEQISTEQVLATILN